MAIPNPEISIGSPVNGINLASRGEMLAPGEYLYLRNVRSLTPTSLQSRNGLDPVNEFALMPAPSIHSIRRHNDYTINNSLYVVGAGGNIHTGTTLFPIVDSGFSGNPLSMIPARPDQSAAPFMYIGDSVKTAKIGVVGGVPGAWTHGIEQPVVPCSFDLQGEPFKVVDSFDVDDWTESVGADVISSRVSTTATAIIYDNGSTGYACVVPAAWTENLQPWMLITVGGEVVKVHSVYPAIATTTIDAISYDAGTTGPCSIVLTTPSDDIMQDSALLINSGGGTAEYVRVYEVIVGPDGTKSFRCETVNNHLAGESITGLNSFRAYFTTTVAAGAAISASFLEWSGITAGTQTLTKTITIDLSNIGGRPVQPDDDFHLSLNINDPLAVSEVKVELDIAATGPSFDGNFFTYSLRTNDLTPAIRNQQSVVQTTRQQINNQEISNAISQRQAVENALLAYQAKRKALTPLDFAIIAAEASQSVPIPDPVFSDVSTQTVVETVTGNNQWTEMTWKVSDFVRVGSDTSRSLADVRTARIVVICTSTVTMRLDSFWVGGTYGPDARVSGFGYQYSYVYRGRATGGAQSNPAPATRSNAFPNREQVIVQGPGTTNTQVDTVDIYRFGGSLSTWQFMGSVDNPGAGTWTFSDIFSDGDIASNVQMEFDNYKPWPTVDLPRSGTVNVIGTTIIRASGDQFNTRWARGSIMRIGNTETTLYTSPTSIDRLEVSDNLDDQIGVRYEVLNGILLNTALPTLIGPYTEGGGEYIFGLGEGSGNLYWTKSGQPESAPDSNFVVVTSPSEPLVGGKMYDGRVFIWSTERQFFVVPLGGGQFGTQEVANGKGLFGRNAVAVNQLLYFMARDGIYESEGGEPTLISGPIHTLFPQESGTSSAAVEDLIPTIDMSDTESVRMYTYGNYVYFRYINTAGDQHTLVWDIRRRIWISDDVYHIPIGCYYGGEGNQVHSLWLGGSDGFIYEMGLTDLDDTDPISCILLTGAKHFEWWRHCREATVAHKTTHPMFLTIETDGTSRVYNVPLNGGTYSNPYIPLQGVQGKSWRYRLDFQGNTALYLKDSVLMTKSWPFNGPYVPVTYLA